MHIPVFAPHEDAKKQIAKKEYGPFKITALPLLDKDMEVWQHTNGDGTQCPCYAFLIEVDKQRLLYVTDTKLLVWNVKKWNINHMLIGLNYMPERVDRNDFKTEHILTGHLSIETVKGIVDANMTSCLQNVILCHLSRGNTDSGKCIEEVKKVAGIANVDVAECGKEWKLYGANECPF
jgi:ribonuclease BN (tRNA processing enzyme)